MTTPPLLDVRAFACPITWVKTRVALERLRSGELLEVWLAPGEPARSVPESATLDGHRVVDLQPLAVGAPGAVRLLIEKGEPPPSLP
jgi:tRNA 2-thiouridine synthesizing protein A